MTKKILLSTFIITSLSFANILSTTDYLNNSHPAFGANPAIAAYENENKLILGTSGFYKIKQNSQILDWYQATGEDLNPTGINDKYLYLSLKQKKNAYISFKHQNIQVPLISIKTENDINPQISSTFEAIQSQEISTFSWSKKTTNNLFYGIELAQNRTVTNYGEDYNNYAESHGYYDTTGSYYEILPHYSLNFGLIKKINHKNIITFSHKLTQKSKYKGVYQENNNFYFSFNEDIYFPNETTIGLVHSFNKKIQLGISILTAWEINYSTVSDYGTISFRDYITLYPYNIYSAYISLQKSTRSSLLFTLDYGDQLGKQKTNGKMFYGTEQTKLGLSYTLILSEKISILTGVSNLKMISASDYNRQLVDTTTLYGTLTYTFGKNIATPIKTETSQQITNIPTAKDLEEIITTSGELVISTNIQNSTSKNIQVITDNSLSLFEANPEKSALIVSNNATANRSITENEIATTRNISSTIWPTESAKEDHIK